MNRPASVWYTTIEGTRSEKLTALGRISAFTDLLWQECSDRWQATFLPQGRGAYFDWPELPQIFPWQHTGSEYKRSWPNAETPGVLRERWNTLARSSLTERPQLFKNTRDRTTSTRLRGNFDGFTGPISEVTSETPMPAIVRYGFRSLDPQYAFRDMRVGDYIKNR